MNEDPRRRALVISDFLDRRALFERIEHLVRMERAVDALNMPVVVYINEPERQQYVPDYPLLLRDLSTLSRPRIRAPLHKKRPVSPWQQKRIEKRKAQKRARRITQRNKK